MGNIENAVDILRESNCSVAISGAGISVAAGLSTFRGKRGIWNREHAIEWSSRKAFDANPLKWYEPFWSYYNRRQTLEPTIAHCALKHMIDDSVLEGIITQNVDGFDLQAGTPYSKVFEIHGNDRVMSCTCCSFRIPTQLWVTGHPNRGLPVCQDGHVLKPDILLFGEESVPGLEKVQEDSFRLLQKAEALLVVGTTLDIQYVADTVLDFAASERPVIVINPERTIADAAATLVLRIAADDAMSNICDIL